MLKPKSGGDLNKNTVSLAGEFAVLSRLALEGYDANMTLGRTKSVDILVSMPVDGRMLKLEVKTSQQKGKKFVWKSKVFGTYEYEWIMSEKHETINDPTLFYCFVIIGSDRKQFRFFNVPSDIVAKYVRDQHRLWRKRETHNRETTMRMFRIGRKGEKYPLYTPTVEEFEDNWKFKR